MKYPMVEKILADIDDDEMSPELQNASEILTDLLLDRSRSLLPKIITLCDTEAKKIANAIGAKNG